jgi:hypothetical protein
LEGIEKVPIMVEGFENQMVAVDGERAIVMLGLQFLSEPGPGGIKIF